MAGIQESTGQLAREFGRAAFGTDAAGYHDARSGYPSVLYDRIFDDLPPQPAILEIGAGTGLVTEQLLRRDPARLVVVEPDPALIEFMAGRMVDTRLEFRVAPFPDAAVDGDGDFDLIAAAACFHWLEPAPALARINQLLRPGGCVALWWNVYREAGIGDPFAEAVLPLLDGMVLPPSEGATGHYSLDWKLHFSQLAAAGFGELRSFMVRRERVLTPKMARDLYASFSFVRALDPRRRDKLLNAIAGIVSNRFDGSAPTVVLTPLYLASKTATRED
jgi:SAM-dependent methyltransferase